MADRREYYKQYYNKNRDKIRGAYRDTHPISKEQIKKGLFITQAQLYKIMKYDPDTGIALFTNRVPVKNNQGYLRVKVGRFTQPVHILIWIYVYGVYPEKFIDHINGNKQDNRLCNLRLVNVRENALNKCYHRAGRLPGIGRTKVGYIINIHLYKGYKVYLGFYKDEQYASAVYIKYLLTHNLVSQEFIDSMHFNLPDLSTVNLPIARVKFYQDSSRKEREYLGELSEEELLILARQNSGGRF